MEIVERRSQSTAWPLGIIVAVLALVLLIGLAAWNGAHRSVSTPARIPSAAATVSGLNPDAQDRNAAIMAAGLEKAETTHGH